VEGDVRLRALQSAKWAVLGHTAPKILQPLLLIVLARLLIPEDFGVVAIVSLVVALAGTVQTLGLTQALVQTDDSVREAADGVFWLNLAISCIMAAFLFLAAPVIAGFFSEPRAAAPLRVMCLMLVVGAFDDVQEALLSRDFKFKSLLRRRLAPSVSTIFVSIPLAAAGFGYWSLVAGALTGSALGSAALWRASSWRPRFITDFRPARRLLPFGLFVTLEGLLGWAFNFGDNLFVGRFLGTTQLGTYHIAFTLGVTAIGYAIGPIMTVAYSAFSRLRQDPAKLRESYLEAVQLMAVLVVPACIGISLTADTLTVALLGDNWIAVAPILRVLAIMPGLGWMISLNSEIYRALGRPDIVPKLHLVMLVIIVPVYFLAVRHGLLAFTLARASTGLFIIPHLVICSRLLDFSLATHAKTVRSAFLASAMMAVWVAGIRYAWDLLQPLDVPLAFFITQVVAGVLAYLAAMYLLDRQLLARFISRLRLALS
jgi:O-antigen/teichoic acid export membrane protein